MTKKKKATLAEAFGSRLKSVMEQRGVSADTIVAKTNAVIKHGALTHWTGGNRFPNAGSIILLSRALDMTPDELLRGVDVPLSKRAEIDAIAGTRKSA